MNILVSSCLLGMNCKYNGKNNFNAKVKELENYHHFIAVCPEVLGGLGVPRMPSEILDKKVLMLLRNLFWEQMKLFRLLFVIIVN